MNLSPEGTHLKKTLLTCATLLLALALGGCGAGPAAPDATPEPTGTAAPPTAAPIAFDAPSDALSPDGVAARAASADGAYLFAANVGKGDALILRAGGRTCLIDAGKARACGRVRAALRCMGVDALDAVFLTHTDDDHAGGLEWLAHSGLSVGAWYASAMYTGVKEKKHPAARAAAIRGQEVRWLRRGDVIPLGDGAALRVLMPESLATDKDDNNSLVLMLECAAGRMLLTGDMELPEEAQLLALGDDLKCDVVKVANHGDDDTTSEAFARACAAQLAVISTDGLEKPGTPDPGVVGRLEAAGGAVVVTEDAGLGMLICLENGAASAESVGFGEPPVDGLFIADVDAGNDVITLQSRAASDIDLTGFTLHSGRGDEIFMFPDGARIAAGGTLAVGTRSTDGGFDWLWDDKNVVHDKKADVIALYDALGRPVDAMESGT